MGQITGWNSEGMDWNSPKGHYTSYVSALAQAALEREYLGGSGSYQGYPDNMLHNSRYWKRTTNYLPSVGSGARAPTGKWSLLDNTDYMIGLPYQENPGSNPDYICWPWEFWNAYGTPYWWDWPNSNILTWNRIKDKMINDLGYTKLSLGNYGYYGGYMNFWQEARPAIDAMVKEAYDVTRIPKFLWATPSGGYYYSRSWTKSATGAPGGTAPDVADANGYVEDATPQAPSVQSSIWNYNGISSSASMTKSEISIRGWDHTSWSSYQYYSPIFNWTAHQAQLWGWGTKQSQGCDENTCPAPDISAWEPWGDITTQDYNVSSGYGIWCKIFDVQVEPMTTVVAGIIECTGGWPPGIGCCCYRGGTSASAGVQIRQDCRFLDISTVTSFPPA